MSNLIKKITIKQPDDWHVHLRDNQILTSVSKYTAKFYKRALIMPNLKNPITNCSEGLSYKKRIIKSVKTVNTFIPLITCYLTEHTIPKELENGFYKKIFIAAKLYPKNSTTNSKKGIDNINKIIHIIEHMEKIGMPLLLHGEEINDKIDIYDREKKFIETTLEPLRNKFPKLKIVLEHITTKEAVNYVKENNSSYLSATITPHHLMFNRNDMFIGQINPYFYCLPILKRDVHQKELRKAAVSGDQHFFLGSDSAPHFHKNKVHSIGCAGIFNAPSSLLVYTTIFEEMNALNHLQAFCSENGPKFYNMPINKNTVTLVRKPFNILKKINIGKNSIIPFLSGKTLNWSIDS